LTFREYVNFVYALMVRLVEEQARADRLVAATLMASGRYEVEMVSVTERRREFDALLESDLTRPEPEQSDSDQNRLHRFLGVA
jgi:hypothetical protein